MCRTSNVYLLLSLIVCVIFPFTGIISLVYSIKARRMERKEEGELDGLLRKSYKWALISVVGFLCCVVVLYVLLFALYEVNRT